MHFIILPVCLCLVVSSLRSDSARLKRSTADLLKVGALSVASSTRLNMFPSQVQPVPQIVEEDGKLQCQVGDVCCSRTITKWQCPLWEKHSSGEDCLEDYDMEAGRVQCTCGMVEALDVHWYCAEKCHFESHTVDLKYKDQWCPKHARAILNRKNISQHFPNNLYDAPKIIEHPDPVHVEPWAAIIHAPQDEFRIEHETHIDSMPTRQGHHEAVVIEHPTLIEPPAEHPTLIEPPAMIMEEHPTLIEPPAMVNEEHPILIDPPAMVIEEHPTLIEPQAMVIEEHPTLIEPQAMVVEEHPTLIEPQAMVVEEHPVLHEHLPTLVTNDGTTSKADKVKQYIGETQTREKKAVFCCSAMMVSCEACKKGISVEDFCAKTTDYPGCDGAEKPMTINLIPNQSQDPVLCCSQMTASCESCKKGISEEEFCMKNTGYAGCEASDKSTTVVQEGGNAAGIGLQDANLPLKTATVDANRKTSAEALHAHMAGLIRSFFEQSRGYWKRLAAKRGW